MVNLPFSLRNTIMREVTAYFSEGVLLHCRGVMTCNALDLGFGPLLYHDLCPVFVWIPGRLIGQGMERVQDFQAFRGSREGLYYG